MSGNLTIIANAGRSGSTFLYKNLKNICKNSIIFHENIPIQVAKPRTHNRAYHKNAISTVKNDSDLQKYLKKWQNLLYTLDIVETGWTCYHLLPVFSQMFKERLRVIVLHREPWSVALSRANMGNYHPRSWYDAAHEVSPYDSRSVAPHYKEIWETMNHAERCLFWWYVIYLEILEFLDLNQQIPRIFISAQEVFYRDGLEKICRFIDCDFKKNSNQINNLQKNSVHQFMAETFPIFDEYRSFYRHQEIWDFSMEKFGYNFIEADVAIASRKYHLPAGAMPRLRYMTDYWTWRRRAGRLARRLWVG